MSTAHSSWRKIKAASKKQLLSPIFFFIEERNVFLWEETLVVFWKTKQLLRNLILLWVKTVEAQNYGYGKYAILQFICLSQLYLRDRLTQEVSLSSKASKISLLFPTSEPECVTPLNCADTAGCSTSYKADRWDNLG